MALSRQHSVRRGIKCRRGGECGASVGTCDGCAATRNCRRVHGFRDGQSFFFGPPDKYIFFFRILICIQSVAALSVTWLVPSARGSPPTITDKRYRYMPLVQSRAPPRSVDAQKKTEPVLRRELDRHVSSEIDEPKPTTPTPAPASAPSSPRGCPVPLPRCKRGYTAGPLPSIPLPLPTAVYDDSPLSSAETLTETPADVRRAFSSRLTRVLRGRRLSRSSTIASTTASSSSATVASEFGEHVISPGKAETRLKQRSGTERGRFTFLKKSKTIDVQTRSRTFFALFGHKCVLI